MSFKNNNQKSTSSLSDSQTRTKPKKKVFPDKQEILDSPKSTRKEQSFKKNTIFEKRFDVKTETLKLFMEGFQKFRTDNMRKDFLKTVISQAQFELEQIQTDKSDISDQSKSKRGKSLKEVVPEPKKVQQEELKVSKLKNQKPKLDFPQPVNQDKQKVVNTLCQLMRTIHSFCDPDCQESLKELISSQSKEISKVNRQFFLGSLPLWQFPQLSSQDFKYFIQSGSQINDVEYNQILRENGLELNKSERDGLNKSIQLFSNKIISERSLEKLLVEIKHIFCDYFKGFDEFFTSIELIVGGKYEEAQKLLRNRKNRSSLEFKFKNAYENFQLRKIQQVSSNLVPDQAEIDSLQKLGDEGKKSENSVSEYRLKPGKLDFYQQSTDKLDQQQEESKPCKLVITNLGTLNAQEQTQETLSLVPIGGSSLGDSKFQNQKFDQDKKSIE